MDALLCSIFLLFASTQIITFYKGHCHELLMQRCLISSQCTLLGYDGDDCAKPIKENKRKGPQLILTMAFVNCLPLAASSRRTAQQKNIFIT
jgi:hypothetical protein